MSSGPIARPFRDRRVLPPLPGSSGLRKRQTKDRAGLRIYGRTRNHAGLRRLRGQGVSFQFSQYQPRWLIAWEKSSKLVGFVTYELAPSL